MDSSADSGEVPSQNTVGGHDLAQELSLPYDPCKVESSGKISLQVLEFKTCLLEAIKELHIRRDAEIRHEEQISKLVLEKQELEWQKESLQHQIETLSKQHAEALSSIKKEGKIRGIEEEKGVHQLTAELRDKEISSLKEELKSLQLSKYTLEKKSTELEQKLALKSRSKDNHLSELGEVEKRFAALSRLCDTIKQAHDKLEHNVDKAIRTNKQLTSLNEKQESTIVSLKQELEEMSAKLVKAKVSSVVLAESGDHPAREQREQQREQQRLLIETEMNRKLVEENAAQRVEKQELMRSLQHAQQLLFSHSQMLLRVELELQDTTEEHQALQQEHRAVREQSEVAIDRVARLEKEHASATVLWENERAVLEEHIKGVQRDIEPVREVVYAQLYQKHSQLTSQAVRQVQDRHRVSRSGLKDIGEATAAHTLTQSTNHHHQATESKAETKDERLTEKGAAAGFSISSPHTALSQMRESSPSPETTCAPLFPEVGSTGDVSLDEANPGLEPPSLDSVRSSPHSRTRELDAAVVTGASRGLEEKRHHQMSPLEESHPHTGQTQSVLEGTVCLSAAALRNKEGRCASAALSALVSENSSVYERTCTAAGGSDGDNDKNDEGCCRGEAGRVGSDGLDVSGCGFSQGGGTLGSQRLRAADSAEGERTTRAGQALIPETAIASQTSGDNAESGSIAPQDFDPMESDKTPSGAPPEEVSMVQADQRAELEEDVLQTSTHIELQLLGGDTPNVFQDGLCDVGSANQLQISEKTAEQSREFPSNEPPNTLNQSLQPAQSPCVVFSGHTADVQSDPGRAEDTSSNSKETKEKCDSSGSKGHTMGSSTVVTQALSNSKEPSGRLVESTSEKRNSQSKIASDFSDSNGSRGDTVRGEVVGHLGAPAPPPSSVLAEEDADARRQEVGNSAVDHVEDATVIADVKVSKPPDPPCSTNPPADLLCDADSSGSAHKKHGSPSERVAVQTETASLEVNTDRSAGNPGCSPAFLQVTQNRVPLATAAASGLQIAAAFSGPPPSKKRDQHRGWKLIRQAFSETQDTENRASLSVGFPPVPFTSGTGSRLHGSCRSLTPVPGPCPSASSESDWFLPSQDGGDQQSSLRAQISKIEQFLSGEGLRLPKKRKTES